MSSIAIQPETTIQPETIPAKMEALLKSLPLPSKSIKVYGGQIVVTVCGYDTAKKWVSVLGKFAKVKVVESEDYAKVFGTFA